MKTLHKYIKKECSNWEVDMCLGATILNTGLFNKTCKCWVMQGKRCPFFEKYLILMQKSTPKGEEAVSEYAIEIKIKASKTTSNGR